MAEEYAYLVGTLAGFANHFFIYVLLYVEGYLEQRSMIPSRGTILYLEDYMFFRWGDRIFVMVMDIGIGVILVISWPPVVAIVLSLVVAVLWTVWWHRVWSKRTNRFDSCYTPGGTTLLGWIHLGYFFIQYFAGFLALWALGLLVLGRTTASAGAVFWIILGLMAVLCYAFTLWMDWRAGRFPV